MNSPVNSRVTRHILASRYIIYIDSLAHLVFNADHLVALHSWIDDDAPHSASRPRYYIRLHLTGCDHVLLEYEDRTLWTAVLQLLQRPLE